MLSYGVCLFLIREIGKGTLLQLEANVLCTSMCGLFVIMADDHVTNKFLATTVSDGHR